MDEKDKIRNRVCDECDHQMSNKQFETHLKSELSEIEKQQQDTLNNIKHFEKKKF